MSNVRSSLALSAANSYLGVALQIASTAIVARLLTPTEIGIFAVAAVFAALATTFRDFGVNEYLIQKEDVTPGDVRACFSLNLAVSWLIGGALFVASPWVAAFYEEPGVGAVMRVQAFNFLLIPFGAVTLAWYRREMNFRPVLAAGIAANVTSFVLAVGLAYAGFGYMSLAWAGFGGVAVTVLVALLHRPAWFPRLPGWRGVPEVFHFGKFASGVFVAGQLGKGAPEMIIGKAAGMADVGMYSRAAALVEIFNRLVVRAVSPVCLPYLSQGVRRDGSVVPSLMQTTTLLTGVGWPFLVFLALAAFPAIRIMYGPQWEAAVPIARILCLVAALELLHRFSTQALFSLGLARQANSMQFIVQGLRVLGLLAVVPFGLVGAAAGLGVAVVCGVCVAQWVLARHAGLRVRDVARAALPSVYLTGLSVLPFLAWTLLQPPAEDNFILLGLGGGALTVAAWLLAARQLRHPVWPEVVRVAAAVRKRLGR